MKLLYLFFVYAYALKPKEQPSGFFNFSRINNITLPSKSSIDSKLYIYTVPNVLRISSGMIAFPNDPYNYLDDTPPNTIPQDKYLTGNPKITFNKINKKPMEFSVNSSSFGKYQDSFTIVS